MHCAPRRQIPRISCYTKLLIVVKGFSKDLVSVRTAQAIRSKKRLSSVRTALAIRLKKECHPWNDSGYPFQENCHPFNQIERLELSIGKRNVIPSNDSGYPFEKNCHRFERLELSVSRATVPNHFHPGRLRRICQKIMQAL